MALITSRYESGLPEKALEVDQALRTIRVGMFECRASMEERVFEDAARQLNDARINFVEFMHSTEDALAKFQKDFAIPDAKNPPAVPRPAYFEGSVHALPGSSILVKEDDPASIIAYTLS